MFAYVPTAHDMVTYMAPTRGPVVIAVGAVLTTAHRTLIPHLNTYLYKSCQAPIVANVQILEGFREEYMGMYSNLANAAECL